MYNLHEKETILEQLELGNKMESLTRQIIVDLRTGEKTENIKASVKSLILPNDEPPPYKELAEQWLDDYLKENTIILIKGRGGQVASVPYSKKESMLPAIIKEFNR